MMTSFRCFIAFIIHWDEERAIRVRNLRRVRFRELTWPEFRSRHLRKEWKWVCGKMSRVKWMLMTKLKNWGSLNFENVLGKMTCLELTYTLFAPLRSRLKITPVPKLGICWVWKERVKVQKENTFSRKRMIYDWIKKLKNFLALLKHFSQTEIWSRRNFHVFAIFNLLTRSAWKWAGREKGRKFGCLSRLSTNYFDSSCFLSET